MLNLGYYVLTQHDTDRRIYTCLEDCGKAKACLNESTVAQSLTNNQPFRGCQIK